MTVGQDLRTLRKARGLTLDELSAISGVSRDDLGRYERGRMTPRAENVRRIAEALNVPLAAIREGMGWTAPAPAEDWETAPDDRLLRDGIVENLKEAYGEGLALSERELRALLETVKASIPALIEHMKDTRPEAEIRAELLADLSVPAADSEESLVERCRLTDQQWEQVRPLLPPENAGRGRAFKSNRLMLDGILYRLRTGTPWKSLPECFGRPKCVADRLRLWRESGVWAEVEARLAELGVLDPEAPL